MINIRFFILLFAVTLVTACSSQQIKNMNKHSTKQVANEVSGTISLMFAPTPPMLARVPKPPINIALVLKSHGSGDVSVHKITDANPVWDPTDGRVGVTLHNFTLNLEAGDYQLLGFEINSQSLGHKEFQVPFSGPYFTIAGNSVCTYVGRINFSFMRLPSGTHEQAKKALQMIANQYNKSFPMIYLPLGTLIPLGFSVNKPEEKDRIHGTLSSSYTHFRKAIDNGCDIKLVEFQRK